MRIRLTQIDGALPNVALMRLAHWHKSRGDQVHVTRRILPELFEQRPYDRVYGSAIFDFSAERLEMFLREWPYAVVGGTGTRRPEVIAVIGQPHRDNGLTVEQIVGGAYEFQDYDGYDGFDASIGYTQRGCRMSRSNICRSFCVVPFKEGDPWSVNTIAQIWRGAPWPKKIHLLDNDFFGNPEWQDRIAEIRDGGFRVSFSQGINTRLMTAEVAAALASVEYRNNEFTERKLYTAWDNIGDEAIFFRGVELLRSAGVPSKHLVAFMLIGSDPEETWERIWYRFKRMTDLGIEPFVMVFNKARRDLVCFQRWVNTGLYRIKAKGDKKGCSWPEYDRETKTQESVDSWRKVYEPCSTSTCSTGIPRSAEI